MDSELNVVRKEARLRVALAFPDIYDVGMSHLGLKILYDTVNSLPYAHAERAFHPWLDMSGAMEAEGVALGTLESGTPLVSCDVVGFSLQYELSYTSVLNMLSLGGIPLRSAERTGAHPVVVAGGPCTVNPKPMAPFIDAFLVGDGEVAFTEMLGAIHGAKPGGRNAILEALSRVEGVYVPSMHDGKSPVRRRFIASLEDAPYPLKPIVPYTEIVHDRVNIEVSRGCTMGCRFCQAGMIYRPLRERSPEKVIELATESLRNTGYDEVAFTSLSAGDYSALLPLLKRFNRKFSRRMLSVSLPSLRVKAVNRELLRELRTVRKSGFTIAPEAATDRLRSVVNKDFREEDFEKAVDALFSEGWHNLKLYFMMGLPGERDEDIEAIPAMVKRAIKLARKHTSRYVNFNVSVSPFVPKAHTPFQYCAQADMQDIRRKYEYLRGELRKVNLKSHDHDMSLLEATFARGDERLADLIEAAWREGARLDGWGDSFDMDIWRRAMDATGIDAGGYARREFSSGDALPWDIVDTGIKKEFMRQEYESALAGEFTPDCRQTCTACGLKCPQGEPEGAAKAEPADLRPVAPEPRFRKPVKLKACFSKTGQMRYLSHRELITYVTRALRRAGIPLEYSQGFNPKPKIAFGPPLGVGVSGLREYFDMDVLPGTALSAMSQRINAELSDEVRIEELVSAGTKEPSLQEFVSKYLYEIKCPQPDVALEFLKKEEALIERKGKQVDVRPMVESVEVTGLQTVRLMLRDSRERNVRLDEIAQSVFGAPATEFEITRLALFGLSRGRWVEPLEAAKQWQTASL